MPSPHRKNDYLNAVNAVRVGNPLGKSVLRLLADLSRANNGFCWPSEAYITEALEMGPATVRKWLGILVDRGIIVKRRLTAAEGQKFGITEWWKRSGFQMNFDPNQANLFSRSKTFVSPLPRSANEPEFTGLSPLPDSSESPPQDSADKSGHRYEVAESALPRITDTSWRNNSSKKEESFKPVAEPLKQESAPPTDVRKSHPAIVAIQATVGLYPPKEIWDVLIDHLGMDIDQPKLKKCFVTWRARGFNKTNYDWALDWYLNGIPAIGKHNGTNRTYNHGSSKQTAADIISGRDYR